MDGEKIFGNIGKAAGLLAATAAIGGTAGYSCVLGVALGLNNLKTFELNAADHVNRVRSVLETQEPEKQEVKEPEKVETTPATRSTTRGSGPTMTAQNEPRTFAAAEPKPLPRKYRTYTYKGTTGALIKEAEVETPKVKPLTEDQKAQLKKYVDDQKNAIDEDRRQHGDESQEDKKYI